MTRTYWQRILDYYEALPFEALDAATVHQVKRSLLDYYGCAAYTAKHRCADGMVQLILDMSAPGEHRVLGETRRAAPAAAACANACRISNIEMDDGSGINAAVHPGLYVWTGALTAWQTRPCDMRTLIRAVVFGYDVSMRMGMLAAKSVSRYELHGPGFSGALGAVASGGMVLGLNRRQLESAFGIAGSLLPMCPFISFIKGTDSKDLYGGWGLYLAMMALEGAQRGLTGPADIFDGVKSLSAFFSDDRGKDTAMGRPYYINVIGFKEFPACLAVHPALICIQNLFGENQFQAAEIQRVVARVSPSAYKLSCGAPKQLTPTAARLSLPYTIAAALSEGALRPEAFTQERIDENRYAALMQRITIVENPEYGEEALGIRACAMTIRLRDGRELFSEARGIRWCDEGATDEGLIQKYHLLTEGVFTEQERARTLHDLMHLEEGGALPRLLSALYAL